MFADDYKGSLKLSYNVVTPYRVRLTCDQEGCDGEMVSGGLVAENSSGTYYTHKCKKCDHEAMVDKAYPYIEYR